MIRGVRGAITVQSNTEKEIAAAAELLLKKMIDENSIAPEEVASVFISATDDIDQGFPAKAMRTLDGWKHVPVMCMREMSVQDALPLCIRVMIHLNTEKSQQEIGHVYLGGAVVLRPDLEKK
ncbi:MULTISPECIES: chorismate mutase [Bacillus]|uniref:chorismate mutase n=1 Tax=Bacillus TaxID=1386 RepID=UPI00209CB926|nr:MULTISPECIES: chorismate mutase [Bacillus]MCP1159571.1 chorismate mutase [Bacillus infantis]MDT0160144.1 chorismate mutase [Bacillus sp. AG4(2022)]